MHKKFLFKVHMILGLTAGVILLIMGITGAMLSYQKEILKYINKDSFIVEVPSTKRLSGKEILEKFEQKFPDAKINAFIFSSSANRSVVINVKANGEGKQARRGINYYINPYTSEVLPSTQGYTFFKLIERIHRGLIIGEVGKQISGICTFALLILMFSGIYVYWKRIKNSFFKSFTFSFKNKKRAFLSNMHFAIGMWVIPFYLLLCITGVTMTYDWVKDGLYKVSGVEKPIRQKRMPAANNKKGEVTVSISNGDVEKIVQLFNKNVKEYENATLQIGKKSDVVKISYFAKNAIHDRARSEITLNTKTNKVIKDDKFEDKALNDRLMRSIIPLHTGEYFGLLVQGILGISSLMMVLFTITGFMMYFKRKEKKSAKKI
ncbi:PepSY-associated TM helix domain protein [Arcobacter nitrofigilis DSM 7299]|uniref:PepSY-associated TM helix domain protein n=1 Tax=Arcobacter nitrofigilis (strain ATCC 33309 / DSM 7299 / CCUG 15893 / LMG 7604 / NCTC 12251 / CI) TaxID=572480 RepID=D5V5K6_ARCNC|nr:PepSY-associated TM helix domain-containing protein [Arcobacter nitrofigilis]ADG92042.1 PepSY-associated TM helix domain protein [Arcobacter nitrofigilis DSM 7299]